MGRGNRGPSRFASDLLRWFRRNRRSFPWRLERDPYRILVAEKLLQQTDVGHVLKVYDAFFARFPTLETLAEAHESDIERIIQPIGFWRIRARDFRRIADHLISRFKGRIPRSIEQLLTIPGVGPYTANAMACFAYGQQRPAIDVNVRRVAGRVFFWSEGIPSDEELERFLRRVMPSGRTREFNWALMDFAALVCRRRPRCSECFARSYCRYYRELGAIAAVPTVSP